MSILENFYLRMGGMFGHTWTSQYGDNPEGVGGDTWSAALADITPAQIAIGLRATLALGSEFPPSAPKFRAMCFGIPSLAQVRDAMRVKAVTPFFRLVWCHIETYRFHRADQSHADRMLAEAYELARDHVMRGGQLPPEPVAEIEQQETKPVRADPEKARPYVESLAKLLGEDHQPAETAQ